MSEIEATPHEASPVELKERIKFERLGTPFLVYRAADGKQTILDLGKLGAPPITIGRRTDSDIALTWDDEVSRVHAQLERVGGEWTLMDNGLSSNGSWVNGDRVLGRRRLHDGD